MKTSLGFEEHMRILCEQKAKASTRNQFYVIEKVYGDSWAPLWLELNCSKEDAEARVKSRNANYPDEVLRVATYCRVVEGREEVESGGREVHAGVEAQRDDFRLKFLTLRSFIIRYFEWERGVCVHTWCPYHKEGSTDLCSAPSPEAMVRENCYRTWSAPAKSVEDVRRRCAELTSNEGRTHGSILRQLTSEFGEALVVMSLKSPAQ